MLQTNLEGRTKSQEAEEVKDLFGTGDMRIKKRDLYGKREERSPYGQENKYK